jgi:hypothetical protein
MLAAPLLAILIVVLSMLAGSLLLHALGAARPIWAEGALGLAALTVVAGLAVRLPGRAVTAAVVILALLAAGSFAARKGFGPRSGEEAAGSREDPVGLAVLLITLAAASIPFLLEGRAGVFGEGIYTNDHAAQLFWTDWLQNGFGPEPSAVAWGYPVGPQSFVAAIAEVTGASLIDVFNGLLLAIPALTGLAALSLLWRLRPGPRIAAASLAALPFLAASFLAQSAFKETVMALFVVGFTAVLALASEPGEDGQPALGRRPAVAAGVVLALGGIFAYSVPALAWFALILAVWMALVIGMGERQIDWGAFRDAIRRRRVPLAIGAVVLVGIAAVSAGRLGGFIERIGDISASTGRLSSPIFPGEALGVWPEGDFRVVRGEVSGALVATAIGFLAVVAGAVVLWRRRSFAVLAALGAAFVVYAGARAFSSIYVESKALAVMAPLVVVVALGGLFAAPRGRTGRALRVLGVAFAIGAGASTFLALREAPVGFSDRGEELEQLAERIEGDSVVFLGVDRFAGYWLRGTLIRSPGGYVPAEIGARPQKVWQQGRAMDLDTLSATHLDEFDYAITTTAPYQSSPPSNMEEVARTDSYVLWERTARTPRTQVLAEGGAPGAVLEAGESPLVSLACRRGPQAPGGGEATVLPEPVVGGPGGWSRPVPFDAPGTARQQLELAPGRWQLSLQYHSQVDLSVSAGALEAELPASLVGMYLTHQGQSAFWPVGEVEVPAGGLEVTVDAAEPAALARAAAATRRVWLGEIAATRLDPLAEEPQIVPLGAACDRYVDRYDPR